MRWGNVLETETRVEQRDGTPVISGYAAVYYRQGDAGTEFTGLGFRERIAPGAFDRTVAEDDIRGLFDHRSDRVLGRTRAGTMKLEIDKRGLRYEIPFDDQDPDHRAVKRKLERGDISGSSFGFRVRDEEWTTEEGEDVRTLRDIALSEVSIVTFPAYVGTNAGVRDEDLAEIRQAFQQHKGDDLEPEDAMSRRMFTIEHQLKRMAMDLDRLRARINQ